MSNTDNFIKASTNGQAPVVATLTNTHTQGSEAFECDNLTGWADTAAFIVYETDSNGNPVPGSETSWVAEKNNKILQNAILSSGTDRDYPASKTMVVADYTAEAHNRLVTALLKIFKQDGALKNNVVDDKHITGVDGTKIVNDSIDGEKIKDSTIKPNHLSNEIKAPQWHDVVFENGFRNYGGSYHPCQYAKDMFGNVYLIGLAANSSTNVFDKPIFNLPEGYRPAQTVIFATPNTSSIGRIDIAPNGDVKLSSAHGASSSFVSLSGIVFKAA